MSDICCSHPSILRYKVTAFQINISARIMMNDSKTHIITNVRIACEVFERTGVKFVNSETAVSGRLRWNVNFLVFCATPSFARSGVGWAHEDRPSNATDGRTKGALTAEKLARGGVFIKPGYNKTHTHINNICVSWMLLESLECNSRPVWDHPLGISQRFLSRLKCTSGTSEDRERPHRFISS